MEKLRLSGICIVTLQRGWIVVGNLSYEGNYGYLKNVAVIRIWGTTKGLGEIAENGPTPRTKLDHCGEICFHELTSIFVMKCNEKNWKILCQ